MAPRSLALVLAHSRWAVGLVATLGYANTLRNAPVLDDGWVIFGNSLIKSLRNVPSIFHQPYNAALTGENAGLYRPITTLSYAINYAVGGPNVVGYHLVNIALHVACCLLVLELGRLFWKASRADRSATPATAAAAPSPAGPLLGALLFAVHPVHVEAVAGMVGRAELLAALGSLGCIYLACTRGKARWRYPAALVALTLGVLSKENAAVTPLLFGLVALALPAAAGFETRPGLSSPQGRRALWRSGALAAGMVCATGLYFLLRPVAAFGSSASEWFGSQPPGVIFNTMTRAVAEYLHLLVFPHPLGTDFYYSNKIPFTPRFTLACLSDTAAWLAVLAFGVAALRRAPLTAAGVLWVFVALLPVLNIVPIGVLMAERLLYLPSVGFCIAAGAGAALLPSLVGLRPRLAKFARPITALVAVTFFALIVKTWSRNADWRDAITLWQAELRKEPHDPVVNNNLAVEYTTRGQLDLARERLQVALRAAPSYWRAHVNMGIVAHRLHDDSAAIRWLTQARQIAPNASSPHFFLAVVLADGGKVTQAVDHLAEAERAAPLDARNHLYRAWYLCRLGRLAEAKEESKLAIALDPALAQQAKGC